MRIKIILSDSTLKIPINNQQMVNSFVHRCLGVNNEYHDVQSNYCVSNIRGCKLNDDRKTLSTIKPFIIVSSNDGNFLNKLLSGISSNNSFGYGINVIGFEFINEELYDGFNLFKTLTPILLREKMENGKKRTITVFDDDFIPKLKQSIVRKLKTIDKDVDLTDFDIQLAKKSLKKTKMEYIKDVSSVGSLCDLVVYSNKKVADMIYNCGIGQSTGSGFGTVYEYKNHKIYY